METDGAEVRAMTKDIYAQHDSAFALVSAFVVVHNGERVATIAFKFPKDGAGRLYAYVHWLGTQMVRGHANGYGYDKRSAACASAARKIRGPQIRDKTLNNGFGGYSSQSEPPSDLQQAFITELINDNGHYWNRRLEDAGFVVWQAV